MNFLNFRIITQIIATTLKTSICLLILTLFGKCSREVANKKIGIWANKLLKIVKVKYKVHNPHNVVLSPNQPYVIMSNHQSHYDIPLIFATFPSNTIRMMAKKELFKVPVWGHAMKQCEFFILDRNNAKSAQNSLKLAQSKMQDGVIPWIAPEGTRSLNGNIQQFKKGGFLLALETKATIVPIFIKGSEKILPAKKLQFGLNQQVDIYINKPIDMTNVNVKDLRQVMQNMQQEWMRWQINS